MRAVIQRVHKARVDVDGSTKGAIQQGLLLFVGVGHEDSKKDADYLAEKIINLRIFEDGEGRMNLSALQEGHEILIISQFTLFADVRKGRRPSYNDAGEQEQAKELYEYFINKCRESTLKIEYGIFGAHMEVSLVNDGPVTILIDSKKTF